MNREAILKLAKAAKVSRFVYDAESGKVELERFAALVAAFKQEQCANVCDSEATIEGIAQKCAAAIRALD